MLGDFDADGDTDVLSGSYPGELYLFRRNADGSFEDGEQLKDLNGDPIKAGRASTVFPFDWDADGDLDLVLGSQRGEVFLVVNEGATKEPAFSEPQRLEISEQLTSHSGNSGPIMADWDGDGLVDMLVGMGDGSAHWFRNTGTATKPEFSDRKTLVEKSAFGFRFENRKPGQWGARVKLCATDFNGDGKLDLLLGDRSGDIVEPDLTEAQRQSLEEANRRLPDLVQERAKVTRELRVLQYAAKDDKEAKADEEKQRIKENESQLRDMEERLRTLTAEYTECRAIVRELGTPQRIRHGFVWLFTRN